MPVYYHISLGDGLNVNKDLKNNLKLNKLIFFSKKDSKWKIQSGIRCGKMLVNITLNNMQYIN